jgi:hypothetical protein
MNLLKHKLAQFAYDPLTSSTSPEKQYATNTNTPFDMNSQLNSGKKDKSKREKEIEQYRKWKEKRREQSIDEVQKNSKRIRGIGSPILPRTLKDMYEKQKRISNPDKEISPLV